MSFPNAANPRPRKRKPTPEEVDAAICDHAGCGKRHDEHSPLDWLDHLQAAECEIAAITADLRAELASCLMHEPAAEPIAPPTTEPVEEPASTGTQLTMRW